MHGLGLIHGDIRPRNFLVDEYGILKLADFKMTQKIPKSVLGDKPTEERGCPPYMAPELFTSDGVHSYQSDFWSMGCLLYELRRGFLPFGDENIETDILMERIRRIEPVENPVLPPPVRERGKVEQNVSIPPISSELADLLLWLLEKAPMNRCQW